MCEGSGSCSLCFIGGCEEYASARELKEDEDEDEDEREVEEDEEDAWRRALTALREVTTLESCKGKDSNEEGPSLFFTP